MVIQFPVGGGGPEKGHEAVQKWLKEPTRAEEPNGPSRAQRIPGYVWSQELGLYVTLGFEFVLRYNPFNNEYHGGSGVSWLARSVATAKTAEFAAKSGNAVVEYNVKMLHY
ncbi:hypothetical protein Sango_0539900 [Sesamum angolense]|uniref:Uncharacterized protein n=1 Tax=Sesamum angolense TaxID=2727404 RepID=A0AAE2C194_9LAMI|nr:hypothetical protein Sango_0539900 [Sesamum angolense]